ncbi:Protein phosphatase 2C 6 [Cryptotrichosporon argae]
MSHAARTLALPSVRPRPSPGPRLAHAQRALYDFIRGPTPGGTFKVPFPSPKVVGVCQSRGSRPYQEDAVSIHALSLDDDALAAPGWDASRAGPPALARQVAYFGIFDGHGGASVSQHVRDHLARAIESVAPADAAPAVDATLALGGYFRRWKGGALARWARTGASKLAPVEGGPAGEGTGGGDGLTLEERLTLAFLKTDKDVRDTIDSSARCGSTASVVLLHSRDAPAQPYWAAKRLALTVAHCGDTRVILCHNAAGEARALTERHHGEARVEAARLRRMGADRLVADSFGESRWMGAIENTRGFGDFEYKPSGVTAEPEVSTTEIDGAAHAFVILATDGLTSLLSDQELVDLCRAASDPTRAARAVVHFAEDLGAQDNCSVVVVPLAGWGKVGGKDTTEARREYRRRQAGMTSNRMARM